jgi:crotonobetainyl-CoA:carnitine CoA-transferase CaiB-like acyl-CoA transferase
MDAGNLGARYLFETSDGWIAGLQAGGLIGLNASTVIDWMAETGEAQGLDAPHWREKLSAMVPLEPEDREFVEGVFGAFVRTRPKLEICAEAQRRNLGWAPVQSPRELAESQQLAAREFWTPVRHEDLDATFTYPGAPWKLSETPWAQRGRAPHIGEHNEEVYGEMLGLDAAELRRLRMRMVI